MSKITKFLLLIKPIKQLRLLTNINKKPNFQGPLET